MPRLPISAAMIIKNEQAYLKASISSFASFVSELVICDTGSSDASLEIAESFRSQVPKFQVVRMEWKDDFALARNFVAGHCHEDWILFIDGDEILERESESKLQSLIRSNEISCYSLIQKNYTRDPKTEAVKPVETETPGHQKQNGEALFYFENFMERLYRNNLGIQYSGRIHESLLPSCQELSLKHERSSLVLHHYGRLKLNNFSKYELYLRLSEQKLKEEPKNPAAWVELGVNLMELKKFDLAYEHLKKAVQKFPTESIILKAAFQAALRMDEWKLAEEWIRKYIFQNPKDLYALSQLSTALLYQGRLDECLKMTEENLKSDPKDFVSHVNLAVIYFERKKWKEASQHIREGLLLRPTDSFLRDALNKIPSEFQKN